MFVEPAVVPDFCSTYRLHVTGGKYRRRGGVSAVSDRERGKESIATKSGQFSATS